MDYHLRVGTVYEAETKLRGWAKVESEALILEEAEL